MSTKSALRADLDGGPRRQDAGKSGEPQAVARFPAPQAPRWRS
jgi:hypothetical protein